MSWPFWAQGQRADAPIVAPPPPSGDPLLQFLPDGMTLWRDNRFLDPLAGTFTVNGWYHTESAPLVERLQDPNATYGPWFARIWWAEGLVSNGTGRGTFWTHPTVLNAREYYIGIRARFSENYRTHSNFATEKFIYPSFVGTATTQTPIIQIAGSTTRNGVPRFGPFQLITYDFSNGPLATFPQVAAPVIPAGEWCDICIYHYIGGPGQPDSIIRVWVNGALAGERTNIVGYLGSQQLFVDKMRISSTRGGGLDAHPVPVGGMSRDMDRLVLYYKG